MPKLPTPNNLLTIQKAAEKLGVSTKTLRRWEDSGYLKPKRTLGNQRRYTLQEIENLKHSKSKYQSNGHPEWNEGPSRGALLDSSPSVQNDSFQPVEYTGPKLASQNDKLNTKYSILNTLATKGSTFRAPNGFRLTGRNDRVSRFGVLFSCLLVLSLLSSHLSLADLTDFRNFKNSIDSRFRGNDIKLASTVNNDLVLAAQTNLQDFVFNVNVPTNLNDILTVSGNAEFQGTVTGTTANFKTSVTTNKLTAPNVIYSLVAGSGISVSTGQTPTITNTGVLSVGGTTGAVTLSAGTGISVSGTAVTNTDLGSAQNIFKNIAVSGQTSVAADSNSDILTFVNGTGITVTTDATNDYITITADTTLGGWTDDGTSVRLTTSTDNVGIGTTNPTSKLQVAGNITPSLTSTYDLGSPSLYWNALYVDNLYPNPSLTGTFGFWQRSQGAVAPGNITDDLLVGGIATASAKFQVGGLTGTVSSGIWHGTVIGTQYGGTGKDWSAVAWGNVPYFSATGTLSTLAAGTANQLLITNGANANPAWTDINNLLSAGNDIGLAGTNIVTINNTSTLQTVTGRGATTSNAITLSAAGTALTVNNNLTVGGTTTYNSLAYTWPATQTLNGVLTTNGSGSLSWATPGGTGTIGYWQRTAGSMAPTNITDSINLGSTATASALIHFAGTAGENSFFNTGNVGIGTTNPVEALDINGAMHFSQVGAPGITTDKLYNLTGVLAWSGNAVCTAAGNCAGTASALGGSGATNYISKWSSTYNLTTSLLYDTGTAVGINTILPLATLDVRGLSASGPVASISGTTTAAAMVIDNNGTGDLFTASSSGVPKFTIKNNGDVALSQVTSGAWQATAISTTYGGTGKNWSAVAQGSLPYFNGTGTMSTLGPGAENQALVTLGAGNNPSWTNIASLVSATVGGNVTVTGTTTLSINTINNPTFSTSVTTPLITNTGDLILNPSGNVGIGTTAPGYKLDVQGGYVNASSGLCIAGSCKTDWTTGAQGYWTLYGTNIANNNAGNVGIGTTNPTYKLDVAGDINTSTLYRIGGAIVLRNPGTENIFVGVGAGNDTVSATGTTLIGAYAGHALTSGSYNTLLGDQAGYLVAGGASNTLIGATAGENITSGGQNTFLGYSSGVAIATGEFNIAIGAYALNSPGGDVSRSVAIGYNNVVTANNQLVVGSADSNGMLNDSYWGNGVTKASPSDFTFNATGGSGTNNTGANLILAGGRGTGSGLGGSLIFKTAPVSGSGSTPNALVERLRIDSTGNVGIGTTSPSALFAVGASSQFQVNSTGNIVLLNNVITSFPASQGAAGSLMTNNGSGTLTWAPPSGTGVLGYWQRNGTSLAPSNIGDSVGIGTTGPTAGLHTHSSSGYDPSLTYNATAAVIFDNANAQLAMGTAATSPYAYSIQGRVSTNAAWNIALQPLGGYVGIGTTNPTSNLEISKTRTGNDTLLTLSATGTGVAGDLLNILFQMPGASGFLRPAAQISSVLENPTNVLGALAFSTAGSSVLTERMRISNGGNVGIGTTNPGTRLSILPAANAVVPTLGTASGGFSILGNNTTYGLYSGVTVGGPAWLQVMSNNSAIAYDLLLEPSGGNVGIGTTAPSVRLSLGGTTGNTFAVFENAAGANLFGMSMDSAPGGTFNTNIITNGIKLMSLNSAGNVGIGTTTPNSKLHVAGGAVQVGMTFTGDQSYATRETGIIFNRGDISTTWFNKISNSISGTVANNTMNFELATGTSTNITTMTLNSAGYVGIGTTTPNTNLEVWSSVWGGPLRLRNTNAAAGKYFNAGPEGGGAYTVYNQDGTGVWMGNGGTTWNANSDLRLKTNINTITSESGLSSILKLNPVTYNWKSTNAETNTQMGFVAQEVQQIFPDLVAYGPDTTITNPDGSTTTIAKPLGLSLAGFVPSIVSAIQEQQGQLNNFQLSLLSSGQAISNLQSISNDPIIENLKTADASMSAELTSLKEQIASMSAQLSQGSNLQPQNLPSNFSLLTSEEATISGNLMVLGKTTISDLGVTGTISAGLMTIDGLNGEINTLADSLKLQSLALGNIEMQGAQVIIDTKGNISTQGIVTAKEIQTEAVKVLGAKSAGSAILPTGETELEIMAESATDSARILLTPTTLTDKVLTVIEKKIGSFKVAIKSVESKDITFDWLIIGN